MNEIATLCRQLSFGVYVVGAAQDERRDAFTAVWVKQASFDPLLLAVSINPQNASYPLVTIQPSTFRAQEKVLDADGRVELQMELLLGPAAWTQWIHGNTTAGNSDGEVSILLLVWTLSHARVPEISVGFRRSAAIVHC